MEPPAMSTAAATLPRQLPLYLAECRYGRFGNAFRETDRDRNSRDEIISLIRSGEIDIIKVIEIDEVEGRCRDVTDELVMEADVIEQRRAA
jgi:hypothetical protein